MNSDQPSYSPYERIHHSHIARFERYISGNENALFCVVSSSTLSDSAQSALIATANQLKYSKRQLVFITLSFEQEAINPHELFTIIESIDPVCVILTDHETVRAASAGYNTPLTLETREFLLGRSCCCFESFETMLSTNEGKQKAWSCLKTLPTLC